MLGVSVPVNYTISEKSSVIVAISKDSGLIASSNLKSKLSKTGLEGFIIEEMEVNGQNHLIIAANNDIGALYGVFYFLRQLQTHREIRGISIQSAPKIQHRLLNHWDNLDRSVERGYAGLSLVREMQQTWNSIEGLIDRALESLYLCLRQIK